MDSSAFRAARDVVARGVGDRVFPAAAIEVGSSAGPLWQDALGTLTFDERSSPATLDTIFDLASLTKPIATTTLVMELVGRRSIELETPVASLFEEWRGADREQTTVGDLLEHASGLPARLVDAPPTTRREFEHEICTIRLEYEPRTRSIYSDLGFILLGFLIEDCLGRSIAAAFQDVIAGELRFSPDAAARRRTAPTTPLADDPRRGRTLAGEVHDNYAAALGGAAGHAGLFGTARGVGLFARIVLRSARGDGGGQTPFSPELVARFTTRSRVHGSSRTFGWDAMLPTSSCGARMSPAAFGHVGFTGTSLWIDPERDRYFVLLTNRAFGPASTDAMQGVRRAFHEALADA